MSKIVIPGGSGYLGRALAEPLVARGDEVVVLTRGRGHEADGCRFVHWDGATLGEAVRACSSPPPVWVQSSSLAVFGEGGDEVIDESTPACSTRASPSPSPTSPPPPGWPSSAAGSPSSREVGTFDPAGGPGGLRTVTG